MKSCLIPGLAICLLLWVPPIFGAQDPDIPLRSSVVPALSALDIVLSRPDLAVMRSQVSPNLVKGSFAESHMTRHVTRSLRATGAWHPITARLGSKGIDGLYLRLGPDGRPTGLIVSEAKFGSGKLLNTSDGIQLGKRWSRTRLRRLANIHLEAADQAAAGKMAVQKMPATFQTKQRIQIPFRDGKAAVFWREKPGDAWKFAGPSSRLEEACQQLHQQGRYLDAASRDAISYRRVLYRMKLDGDTLVVHVKNARFLDQLQSESRLPLLTREPIRIPLGGSRLERLRQLVRAEVASILRKQVPRLSASEAAWYANEITRSTKNLAVVLEGDQASRRKLVSTSGLKAGAILGIFDLALSAGMQAVSEGKVRGTPLLKSGLLSLGGGTTASVVGSAVVRAEVKNQILHRFARSASAIFGGGSAALASRSAGALASGTVFSIIYSYGGYLLGLHDLRTANRTMVASGVGMGAGALVPGGLMLVASTFGTASTGTAIATLHGAAATKAATAWLGGGAISAGGFGAAGGAVVITGGAFIVAIGTSAAVMYGFHLYDESQDTKRVSLSVDMLLERTTYLNDSSGEGRRLMEQWRAR